MQRFADEPVQFSTTRDSPFGGPPIAASADALPPEPTVPAMPTLPSLDLQERGDFIVDTQNAWPISVSHTRRVRIAPSAGGDAFVHPPQRPIGAGMKLPPTTMD